MGLGKIIGASVDVAVDKGRELAAEDAAKPDPLRWFRRSAFLAALVIGWLFILWHNRFHVTPPTVFVCLGYLAVLSAAYALWRTASVAVTDDEEYDDSTWGRPLGAEGELEREKKTLLKAIKEAEFDREMGKLSKVDAEQMIAVYRGRAIEVIKELDKLAAGAAGTVREQIEREVKARLELDAKTKKTKDARTEDREASEAARVAEKGKKAKKGAAKANPDAATDAKSDAATDAKRDDKADAEIAATTTETAPEPVRELTDETPAKAEEATP